MDEKQIRIQTPVGPLYLVASEKGLQKVSWVRQNVALISKTSTPSKASQWLKIAQAQLIEFFQGHRTQFEIPFDLRGTEFQLSVWKELQNIPFGKTVSYQDIATKIQRPKATRAVGSANGKNPVCLIIPCHRVINRDGKIGGYSGGLSNKRKLLKFEGLNF